MVDFKKRLAKATTEKPVEPGEIYDRLDRASDKGPLRPAQRAVLEEWHRERRGERDVIVKLHTGQGKTLVGLLMLQSRLNEKEGRALYLCPNHFLVNQTLAQAKQFGIPCVPPDKDGELPADFLDGTAILVAPVQKLFNGLTKFGLGATSLRVDSLVVDDAHACIDSIKDACLITLERTHPAYQRLLDLFESDLQDQGAGTFAQIRRHTSPHSLGPVLPVPYWAWADHHHDVAAILADNADGKAVKFAWPLLRDRLRECLCVVAGRELVISPYLPPLEDFGTFARASHRVFMSATVTDDSFLVRGLGLSQKTIETPLVDPSERWSGERMVLIPSLIDDSLDEAKIVGMFAKPSRGRRFGIVALTPSFESTKDWKAVGAVVATRDDIDARVEQLRNGDRDNTLVVANRYDGIDLPDDTCRILVLDGKPHGDTLLDRYVEECRPGSTEGAARTARTIEQGLGRGVRGEKDYCVILLTGADLVKAIRTKEGRSYLSDQTRLQVELGIDVSEYAREDITQQMQADEALRKVMIQCLNRDEGWKEFYRERMDTLRAPVPAPLMLDVFTVEYNAEKKYLAGEVDGAVKLLQGLVDRRLQSEVDKAWYLQEMARYTYASSKPAAEQFQAAAHRRNHLLMKPRGKIAITKLESVGQRRAARILEWVGAFDSFQELTVAIDAILGDLRFGVRAERFEKAWDDLGKALGFASERPDKEWKAGPDNLWALRDGEYLLVECKSEVETTRSAIHKDETGQMNNASAWFSREYPGAKVRRVLIIPPRKVSTAAGFNEEVEIMRAHHLNRLSRNVRAFFGEFRTLDLRDVSEEKVQALLVAHHIELDSLLADYTDTPKYVA